MNQVVIVDALRTPTGTYGRSLRDVTVEDLGALVIKEIVSRNRLDASKIDLVTMGNVVQTSEAPNLARVALLKAGLPYTIPGYTIHINCGSGLQAVNSAYHAIAVGDARIAIGGGAESMSTAPYLVRGPRFGMRGSGRFIDYLEETGFNASSTNPDYAGITMGLTAENVAEKYNISREEQDRFALQSQQRAVAAIKEGKFKREIVPVPVPDPDRKGVRIFAVDEHPRPETMLEGLAKLGPLFKKNGTVTAGNACGLNDAAAAILLMEEKTALEIGYEPLVRVVSQAVSGVHPGYMGIGPVPAITTACERAGISVDQLDLIELNEAFAAQALGCIKELKLDESRVNVNGGAIALGHPLGCTGAKIAATLIYEMLRRQVRYGAASLCIGGGMGIATIFELYKYK